MKTIPVAAGVAMALALADPACATEAPRADRPCPILRPMAKCALEGRTVDAASAAPEVRRGD